MTLLEWLTGWAILIVEVAALVVAARGLRHRLCPDWRGPVAVLAASILGLCLLVGVGQLLGTFGWFERVPVLVALVVLGILLRPRPGGHSLSAAPPANDEPDRTVGGVPSADLSAAARRELPTPTRVAGPTDELTADPTADPKAYPYTDPTTATHTDPIPRDQASGLVDPSADVAAPTDRPHRPPPADGWGWAVRLALAAGLVTLSGTWLARTFAAYRHGVADGDTLMYHLPFATHFVQSGDVAAIPSVSPHPWVNFYPANVELIQASAMLPFRHVALVPLLNVGWLALGLLAGWCLGARRDRGPMGLLLAALLLALPIMLPTQAGTARVDVAVTGLVLAAVVLLFQEPRTVGSCLLAGLAAGLAIGTKFAALPAVGLLLVTAGLVLWWRHGRWLAAAWTVGAALPGAFWLVRNWGVAGSPLPVMDLRLGPLGFAAPDDERFDMLDGTSILDQLRNTPDVARETMQPAIGYAFGSQGFAAILLLAGVVGAALVLLRRPVGLPHAVAVTALGAGAAYVVSPNTAPILGFELHDNAAAIVGLNARYLVPGLLLLLGLLPLGLSADWRRTSALLTLGTAGSLLYFATRWDEGDGEWQLQDSDVVAGFTLTAVLAAVLAVGVLVMTPVGPGSAGRRPPLHAARGRRDRSTGQGTHGDSKRLSRHLVGGAPWTYGAGVGLLVVVALVALVAGTWNVVRSERLNRYEGAEPEMAGLWQAVHAEPSGQRVAVVGEWLQQPYARDDLGNEVEYLGLAQGDGLFRQPTTCQEMRRALRAGDYDLVAVQRGVLSFGDLEDQTAWVTSIPGSELLAENATGTVVRLPADLAPGCDAEEAP